MQNFRSHYQRVPRAPQRSVPYQKCSDSKNPRSTPKKNVNWQWSWAKLQTKWVRTTQLETIITFQISAIENIISALYDKYPHENKLPTSSFSSSTELIDIIVWFYSGPLLFSNHLFYVIFKSTPLSLALPFHLSCFYFFSVFSANLMHFLCSSHCHLPPNFSL